MGNIKNKEKREIVKRKTNKTTKRMEIKRKSKKPSIHVRFFKLLIFLFPVFWTLLNLCCRAFVSVLFYFCS